MKMKYLENAFLLTIKPFCLQSTVYFADCYVGFTTIINFLLPVH